MHNSIVLFGVVWDDFEVQGHNHASFFCSCNDSVWKQLIC